MSDLDDLVRTAGCDDLTARPAYWEDCRLPGLTYACKCKDGLRHRAIGNGGAVPVLTWIGRRLKNAMEKNR